jgi:hypothetical protein
MARNMVKSPRWISPLLLFGLVLSLFLEGLHTPSL